VAIHLLVIFPLPNVQNNLAYLVILKVELKFKCKFSLSLFFFSSLCGLSKGNIK
jgi:hypothetical protein